MTSLPEESLSGFETLSLADLAGLNLPPTRWVVEDVFPAASLVLLVGRPKAGKSLLMLDLAASVAAGDSFLGRATEQGPAIYVPAEDALPLVRERLSSRLGAVQDIPLSVLPVDGSLNQSLRLDSPASFTRLVATVVELRPRLLILDPFRELHHLPENEADNMATLLRPLRQLAHRLNVLIILVHHRNKSAPDAVRAARGSSAITGGVDAVITLDLSEGSKGSKGSAGAGLSAAPTLTLQTKGRHGPAQRLTERLRPGLRWEPVEPALLDSLPVVRRILGHLEMAGGPLTAAELQAQTGSSTPHVQNALRSLLKSGRVVRDGAGTKGSPFRYHLPTLSAVARSPTAG